MVALIRRRRRWERCSGVLTSKSTKEAPVSESYEGKQIVGIDLHRRRSVLVRMTEAGEVLERCGSPTTRDTCGR